MPDQSKPRVIVIELGDEFRAVAVPAIWDLDDIDRYLNGMAYGRAAVVTLDESQTARFDDPRECTECDGHGECYGPSGDGSTNAWRCPECDGSGVSPMERGERCIVCKGAGA